MGVVAAINDMLVRAPGGRYIVLFPMWPTMQPASFTTLRTKGGYLVSASWDVATQTVSEPVQITATVTGNCTLQHPWPTQTQSAVPRVHCPDERSVTWDGPDRVTWSIRAGETCVISIGNANNSSGEQA